MPDTSLMIAGIEIIQDIHGRYSLNTLHKASGAKEGKEPWRWADRKSSKDLIAELQSQTPDYVFDVVKGGNAPGSYAHELLAVSYAGWISPAFQLKVNQAFLQSKRQTPTVPQVRDPAIQMLIDMAVRLDEARTIASEANTKATLALASQQWLTIREYCYLHQLERQLPASVKKAYGTYLTGYCLQHGIPVRDMGVGDRQYRSEHAYHVEVIATTLPAWLVRRDSQPSLAVVPSREDAPA